MIKRIKIMISTKVNRYLWEKRKVEIGEGKFGGCGTYSMFFNLSGIYFVTDHYSHTSVHVSILNFKTKVRVFKEKVESSTHTQLHIAYLPDTKAFFKHVQRIKSYNHHKEFVNILSLPFLHLLSPISLQ